MRDLGAPASIHGNFQGSAQVFAQSLAAIPLLILAALVAVYIVLGILYENTIHPLTILSTLPSAGIGATLALLLFDVPFSMIALIGIILLIGIVKKNAIMMIDVAIHLERDEKRDGKEAIHEAAVIRLRPIMMTTAAAVLGAVPLAIGIGQGASLRQPLGITVMGGLILSQIFTLFTTPVIYLSLDRLRLKLGSVASGLLVARQTPIGFECMKIETVIHATLSTFEGYHPSASLAQEYKVGRICNAAKCSRVGAFTLQDAVVSVSMRWIVVASSSAPRPMCATATSFNHATSDAVAPGAVASTRPRMRPLSSTSHCGPA